MSKSADLQDSNLIGSRWVERHGKRRQLEILGWHQGKNGRVVTAFDVETRKVHTYCWVWFANRMEMLR